MHVPQLYNCTDLTIVLSFALLVHYDEYQKRHERKTWSKRGKLKWNLQKYS